MKAMTLPVHCTFICAEADDLWFLLVEGEGSYVIRNKQMSIRFQDNHRSADVAAAIGGALGVQQVAVSGAGAVANIILTETQAFSQNSHLISAEDIVFNAVSNQEISAFVGSIILPQHWVELQGWTSIGVAIAENYTLILLHSSMWEVCELILVVAWKRWDLYLGHSHIN